MRLSPTSVAASGAARVSAGALSLLCALAPVGPAAGQAPAEPLGVQIEGGADTSGQNYTWIVTNRYSSPIVQVEFPHYRADQWIIPDGWIHEATFLVNVGVTPQPGICRATAKPPVPGIYQNRSAEFRMRIARGGARRALGRVIVRFEDGKSTTVAGVELPHGPAAADTYLAMFGFALVFGIIVALEARRRRKARMTTAPGAPR